jgi:hypothetical protein
MPHVHGDTLPHSRLAAASAVNSQTPPLAGGDDDAENDDDSDDGNSPAASQQQTLEPTRDRDSAVSNDSDAGSASRPVVEGEEFDEAELEEALRNLDDKDRRILGLMASLEEVRGLTPAGVMAELIVMYCLPLFLMLTVIVWLHFCRSATAGSAPTTRSFAFKVRECSRLNQASTLLFEGTVCAGAMMLFALLMLASCRASGGGNGAAGAHHPRAGRGERQATDVRAAAP